MSMTGDNFNNEDLMIILLAIAVGLFFMLVFSLAGCSGGGSVVNIPKLNCKGIAESESKPECLQMKTIWSVFNLEHDRCMDNITGGKTCVAEGGEPFEDFLNEADRVLNESLSCMETDYTQFAPVNIIMYDSPPDCPPIGYVAGCTYRPSSVWIPKTDNPRQFLILADKFVALFHELGHAYGWQQHDVKPETHQHYCKCEYTITGGVESGCKFILE